MSLDLQEAREGWALLFFRRHPEYRCVRGDLLQSFNEEGVWHDDAKGSTSLTPWNKVFDEIGGSLPDGEDMDNEAQDR